LAWDAFFYNPQDQPYYFVVVVMRTKLIVKTVKLDGTVLDTLSIDKTVELDKSAPQVLKPAAAKRKSSSQKRREECSQKAAANYTNKTLSCLSPHGPALRAAGPPMRGRSGDWRFVLIRGGYFLPFALDLQNPLPPAMDLPLHSVNIGAGSENS
jgi:hypothetical protein